MGRVAHLVVHGTSGSTSDETIPHVQFESSGGVVSTVDMVVQRRDGPRRLREHDDDDYGLTHGLGWVEIFHFLVGRVGLDPLQQK